MLRYHEENFPSLGSCDPLGHVMQKRIPSSRKLVSNTNTGLGKNSIQRLLELASTARWGQEEAGSLNLEIEVSPNPVFACPPKFR